jgi:hypothetical protein
MSTLRIDRTPLEGDATPASGWDSSTEGRERAGVEAMERLRPALRRLAERAQEEGRCVWHMGIWRWALGT